jgi:hypothetical protein
VNPLRLQSLALGASLAHVIIDFQIGLFGSGPAISAAGAANIVDYAAIYALWGWALGAAAGSRGAVAALVVMAGLWAAFAQGLVGFAVCPPPCGRATGLQDAAHFLSLAFGSWAAVVTLRALRESGGRLGWWPTIFALVLIGASLALQGAAFAANR